MAIWGKSALMPHIDTIVRYVASEIQSETAMSLTEAEFEELARHAVAAVRRFDLQHRYEPLNARAWSPQRIGRL